MFIKEVVKKNRTGTISYVYHRLVQSYRTKHGPRQRTVLNLGRLPLEKIKWSELARRIEELITHQRTLIPADPEIENLARHYADLLIESDIMQAPIVLTEKPDYEAVDLHSVSTSQLRTIGAEHVCLSELRRLGFERIFREAGLSERQIKLACLLIVGRMVLPASELRTFFWAQRVSAIGELLQLSLRRLSHMSLYRISDELVKRKDEIEKRLYEQEDSLFSLSSQLILYDLTNTYFETEIGGSAYKRYGKSKEHRTDCPLVTLGIALDEHGFIRKSKLFAGNVGDVTTLATMLNELSNGDSSTRGKTVIVDAGIGSQENLYYLMDKGYDYVAVSRSRPTKPVSDADFVVIRHKQDDKVEACLWKGAVENILWCRSYRRSKKEESMRSRFQDRFEADLRAARDALRRKGGTKRYPKVLERIGRLKQRHAHISSFYEITVVENRGMAVNIDWKFKQTKSLDDRFSGNYYLRTSRTDLTEQELWSLYVTLTDVEDSFRSMKSELGIRPVYHQKDRRIEGHLFITVLAHHVLNAIQRKLHAHDIFMRWESIRLALSTQQRSTTTMDTRDGRKILMRTTSDPEPFHLLIAEALSIPSKPLGRRKLKQNP